MRSFCHVLVLGLLLAPVISLRAQDAAVMVFQDGGLKNNYRVVFEQWDEANHFATGALEIADNNDDKVHTRIPFSADVKTDAKDSKTEVLSIRGTPLLAFFPPANKKEPFPPLTWKLTGRKSKSPTLKATFWVFGKDSWKLGF